MILNEQIIIKCKLTIKNQIILMTIEIQYVTMLTLFFNKFFKSKTGNIFV